MVVGHPQSQLPASEREGAIRIVSAQLTRRGLTVADLATSRTIAAWVGDRACDTACGAAAARAHGFDAAAIVRVTFSSRGTDAEGQVVVVMTGHEGTPAAGYARFEGRTAIPRALREAARAAARAFPERLELALFTLAGSPRGAEVLVDGIVSGRLPLRELLPRGAHTIAARAPGFRAEQQLVHVRYGDAPRTLRFDLAPLSGEPAGPTEPSARAPAPTDASGLAPADARGLERASTRRGPRWLGPTVLSLAAAGSAVTIGAALRRSPPRPDAAASGQYSRYEARTGRLAAVGVAGGLALVGAVTWAVAGARKSRRAPQLSVGLDRAQMAISF